MQPGTSPSITGLSNGGYEAAMETNTRVNVNNLLVAGAQLANLGQSLDTKSSPSITANGTSYVITFQGSDHHLWTYDPTATTPAVQTEAGMMAGTSPAIGALATGGWEVAFQANIGVLWTYGSVAGSGDTNLAMAAGTNPAIVGLNGGGYEIAFQGRNGHLWVTGSASTGDTGLAMTAGTSPSIAALTTGGYEVAFQAPLPPPAPPPPTPAPAPTPTTTTRVQTTPAPRGPKAIKAQFRLKWHFHGARTRLVKISVVHMPPHAYVHFACVGKHCPKFRGAGSKHLKRLERRLEGHVFPAGDILQLGVSKKGLKTERVRVKIRRGRAPRIWLVRKASPLKQG